MSDHIVSYWTQFRRDKNDQLVLYVIITDMWSSENEKKKYTTSLPNLAQHCGSSNWYKTSKFSEELGGAVR